MLVIGDREAADGTVSVRSRSGGDLGPRSVDAFITDALGEIQRRDLGAPAPVTEKQPA
jgi:threonyl-tRNA synthetase